MKSKKEGYKTAQTTIGTIGIKEGEFVSVKYYFTDSDNVDWYEIGRNSANLFTAYPAHHLTRFTF